MPDNNEERESPVSEETFNKIMEFMSRIPEDSIPPTRLEEQKFELLAAYYKTDIKFRAWVIFSTDIFALSTLQGKFEILVDGLVHLKKIILD